MQVTVGPAHGNLKDFVQAIEFDTAWYLKPPPDGRLAATQRDFKFVEGRTRRRLFLKGCNHPITKDASTCKIVNGRK
jgi:hypothetical protein